MAVTTLAAWALNPPILPAMALPIMFFSILRSTSAEADVLRTCCMTWPGMTASQTTDLPRPSTLATKQRQQPINKQSSQYIQVAVRSSSIVPGWRLPADRGLRTPPASLLSRQRPHCSENKHSTWRQKFLGRGSENLEQSTRLNAEAWHWIWTL